MENLVGKRFGSGEIVKQDGDLIAVYDMFDCGSKGRLYVSCRKPTLRQQLSGTTSYRQAYKKWWMMTGICADFPQLIFAFYKYSTSKARCHHA